MDIVARLTPHVSRAWAQMWANNAEASRKAQAEALANHAIALKAYRESLSRGDTRKAHETHAALKKAQALRLKVGC